MNSEADAPSDEDVRRFMYLSPMLDSALSEMREFAKKKQEGIVSATKIKLINRLLADIKAIVKQEKCVVYLDLLSEESSQNSDAVLVLGQYRAALDSFEKRNCTSINYETTWLTKEWHGANESRIADEKDEDVEGDEIDELDDEQFDDEEFDGEADNE